MNTPFKSVLLASLLFGAWVGNSVAEEKKVVYPPTAAQNLLETACKQAASESKLIFLKSGFPECGWCRIFDKYHSTPAVQQIIGKYYVVEAIDWENMPDGKAVFSKFAEVGAPSWVILTPDKKVIISSYAPFGNVGYPAEPNESDYYLAALKKASPAITADELKTLAAQLQKARGK
jgi:hypothetical protein